MRECAFYAMKIVFFGNATEKIAAIRYRVIWFAERMRVEGHTCVVCLPASVSFREGMYEGRSRLGKLIYLMAVVLTRIAQLRHVIGADVVYFRGPVFEYGPPVFERIIHLFCKHLVFDIDDAVWERPAHVDSPFLRAVDFDWTWKMCAMCSHAVVGNRYLAERVGPHMPTGAVSIIPTCIDMEKHTPKTYPVRAPGEPVVLGWTGLADNLGYMKPIEPVLRELATRYPLKILVTTGRDYVLDGVEVENRRWRMEGEIQYLQEADIGLMPLQDTPRARGKCAFKALQYMGVGTPCVISPVGMNAEVIAEGVDGCLADTPEEWRAKLERLIADAGARERMGRAAREAVIAKYSHEANWPVFQAAIAAAAERDR